MAPSLINSNTQLNVFDDGILPSSFSQPFNAGRTDGTSTNVEVNIFGGLVGEGFRANKGSTVNILGGEVGESLTARYSNVYVTGGTIESMSAREGGLVSVDGGQTGYISAWAGGQIAVTGGVVGSISSGAYGAGQGGVAVISGGILSGASVLNLSTLTIEGGIVEWDVSVREEGNLSITGGNAGRQVIFDDRSTIAISGGAFGRLQNPTAPAGVPPFAGTVTLYGSDFLLNGVPIQGLDDIGDQYLLIKPEDFVLSGILEDGTSFLINHASDRFHFTDRLDRSRLNLVMTSIAPIGPAEISTATDPVPLGIRSGQKLLVATGTVVGNNLAAGPGSHVEIDAEGTVGANLEAVDAEITLRGTVGDGFNAYDGSTVNILGGTVGRFLDVHSSNMDVVDGVLGIEAIIQKGSVFTAENTSVGENMRVDASTFTIAGGGILGSNFYGTNGSTIILKGGTIGEDFVLADSTLRLVGDEFRINGAILTDMTTVGDEVTIALSSEDVLSGTFADGTPFMFSQRDRDNLTGGTITLVEDTLPAAGPAIVVASQMTPRGVRQGQTMLVDAGGNLGDHFNAGHGSNVLVQTGGEIGTNMEAVGASVLLTGGSIGTWFDAFEGTSVVAAGGTIGELAQFVDSSLLVNGGGIGRYLTASNSSIMLSAGSIGERGEIRDGSVLTVDGGELGIYFKAFGSTVTIADGLVNFGLQVNEGSTLTVTGGRVEGGIIVSESMGSITGGMITGAVEMSAGRVAISGGRVGGFSIDGGSQLTLSGGATGSLNVVGSNNVVRVIGADFRLDGQPIADLDTHGEVLPLAWSGGSVLSGTLADGTPFIHSSHEFEDRLAGATYLLQFNEPQPAVPGTFVASIDGIPSGLRAGQTLIADSGSEVPEHFVASWGSRLEVGAGATVGYNFESIGAEVLVSGGSLGHSATIFEDSKLTMISGSIGFEFRALAESEIHIAGGTINRLQALAGSEVLIAGGTVTDLFAYADSTILLEGTKFFLGNTEITNTLMPYESVEIANRDTMLRVVLRDGRQVFVDLRNGNPSRSFVDPTATLAITRIIQGDFNEDAIVDNLDLAAWQNSYQDVVDRPFAGADGNGDLRIDGRDFLLWQRHFGSFALPPALASQVPEPNAVLLLAGCLLFAGNRSTGRAVRTGFPTSPS